MSSPASCPPLPSTRKAGWLIALTFLVLVVLGSWAASAELDQLARAQGQVIASARTQVIQAATDGVLERLEVREGQAVRQGQLLARLERGQYQAAVADSRAKVAALKAALARLQAEVFARPLAFPAAVRAYPAFVDNQTELFQRRQAALHAEIAAFEESLALTHRELGLAEKLLATGDIGQADVIRLQKQAADLKGQITNRRNKYFQEAQEQMTRAEEELATQEQMLAERSVNLERTAIIAPADGLVRNIAITTPGARLRPGDVVMEILPTGGKLILEAKLKPADIAVIRKGLPAAIKLDAFDYSIYGVLIGQVAYISPDALTERTPQGDAVYYRVHLEMDEALLAERNRRHPARPIEIQPGMIATVEITTGRQTVLQYLTKPVTKTLSESLGER